jgi:hypothetical protein
MRQYLLKGFNVIFDENISTVIYGRGKDIWNTFNDFNVCAEPYLLDRKNKLLYFGDLDYEGIVIYEQLYNNFKDSFYIEPFVKAYSYMVDKAEREGIKLPASKEGQNKNIRDTFLNNFSDMYREKLKDILKSGGYIPQEIINLYDLIQEEKHES